MACFVRRPFFVHIVIDTRQGAQYGPAPAVETDVGANGVHDVDAWGLFQFPRTRLKSIRFRGQGTHGAQVNHIARKLALHGVLKIGRDLHVLAATNRANLFDAGDLFGKTDAAGALNAARHHRFDKRPHIFFGNRALIFLKTRRTAPISHALVLQIAFAALVANRAIKRVVDEQKFHHPFTRLFDHRRIGTDDLALGGWQSARRLRLWRPGGNLNQAHTAIARNGQPFMIAEARNFFPRHLARLQDGCASRDFDFETVYGYFRH